MYMLVAFLATSTEANNIKALDLLVLQPLRWRCVDCVIHHERDVCEE